MANGLRYQLNCFVLRGFIFFIAYFLKNTLETNNGDSNPLPPFSRVWSLHRSPVTSTVDLTNFQKMEEVSTVDWLRGGAINSIANFFEVISIKCHRMQFQPIDVFTQGWTAGVQGWTGWICWLEKKTDAIQSTRPLPSSQIEIYGVNQIEIEFRRQKSANQKFRYLEIHLDSKSNKEWIDWYRFGISWSWWRYIIRSISNQPSSTKSTHGTVLYQLSVGRNLFENHSFHHFQIS